MNRRPWIAILSVAIVLGLVGGLLSAIDGNWLSGLPALFGAAVGTILLCQWRKPGWSPPRSIPRWRLIFFWALLLVVSALFAGAAIATPHPGRRWIAVALILMLLSIGTTATVVVRRTNSSGGRAD